MVSGFLKGLCPTVWPQQKYAGTENENVEFQAVSHLSGRSWPPKNKNFSVSYPIVYDGIHKCQILLSGQAAAFVSKYCPLCNREADIGLTCPVHS